jgi:hypothetical protein
VQTPNVGDLWPVWRLVVGGLATLEEIDRYWTVTDVLDANEAADAWESLRAGGRPAPDGVG